MDIQRLGRLYQKRLRLDSWKIAVRWGTPEELFDGRELYGIMHPDPDDLAAEIVLRRPEDYTPDMTPDSVESSLWHEMLHIVIDHHKREVAINLISGLLNRTFRGRDGK